MHGNVFNFHVQINFYINLKNVVYTLIFYIKYILAHFNYSQSKKKNVHLQLLALS